MKVAYYFTTWCSTGLDEYAPGEYDTEAEAIRVAKKHLRDKKPSAHAVITEYGGHLATVVWQNGRLLVKRPKGCKR